MLWKVMLDYAFCFHRYYLQRSVTSVLRCHAIRRGTSAVLMVRVPTLVCANLAGKGFTVRRVGVLKRERCVIWVHPLLASFGSLFICLTDQSIGVCYFLADIDECKDPGFLAGCKQGCKNTLGSFQCFCYSGYYQHDGINCIGEPTFVTSSLYFLSLYSLP